MKIGSQLQMAIANMDKQVELARKAVSDLEVNPKEAAREIEAAKEADGSLGKHIDTEA